MLVPELQALPSGEAPLTPALKSGEALPAARVPVRRSGAAEQRRSAGSKTGEMVEEAKRRQAHLETSGSG
jgi:hypothetical protein